MKPSKMRYLPLLVFFGLPGTFIITHFMSISFEHNYPLFPLINDIGSKEPESCVFSMLLNLTAATMLFIVYVRHKQIDEFIKAKNISEQQKYLPVLNLVSTCFGALACLGLDVVANFQINRVGYVHDIGAMSGFINFCIYIFIQTILSFWMTPEMTSLWIVGLRGVLGLLAVIFVVTNFVFEGVAENNLQDFLGDINRTDILMWTPSEPGWTFHIISGISQWISILALCSFILTYYIDFKRVTIYPPELVMIADPVLPPVSGRTFKSFTFLAT